MRPTVCRRHRCGRRPFRASASSHAARTHSAPWFRTSAWRTADSLAALNEAKEKGALTLGIVNTVGSTISRETDAGIYNHAGPEISVASTKAFTSQLSIFALLSLYLARQRQMSLTEGKDIINNLKKIPAKVKQILKNVSQIKRIAKKYKKFNNFFFMGRKYNYPIALEGALKLKEIAYLPAQGYGAGEMKHGPIALINEYRAVVCIAPRDSLYPKMVSNIQEIKARRGKVLAIVNDYDLQRQGLSDADIVIPGVKCPQLNPLLIAIPLQLFSYFVAKNLGCAIDQPRNLAKSVTVE